MAVVNGQGRNARDGQGKLWLEDPLYEPHTPVYGDKQIHFTSPDIVTLFQKAIA